MYMRVETHIHTIRGTIRVRYQGIPCIAGEIER